MKENPKRVLGYLYEEPQRLDLVEKKDWLQNYKYRVLCNVIEDSIEGFGSREISKVLKISAINLNLII